MQACRLVSRHDARDRNDEPRYQRSVEAPVKAAPNVRQIAAAPIFEYSAWLGEHAAVFLTPPSNRLTHLRIGYPPPGSSQPVGISMWAPSRRAIAGKHFGGEAWRTAPIAPLAYIALRTTQPCAAGQTANTRSRKQHATTVSIGDMGKFFAGTKTPPACVLSGA